MLNHPSQAFIREQLIAKGLVGFLQWRLPQDSNYLSGLGPSLFLRILSPKAGIDGLRFSTPWRNHSVGILRYVLETQDIDPNETQYNMDPRRVWSPWTVLLIHTTSWTRGTARIVEERFCILLENGILSMMLRKGADPNVTLWQDPAAMVGVPAFAAYLNLVFEISSDTTHQELYLRTLGDFFRAGATIDPSYAA